MSKKALNKISYTPTVKLPRLKKIVKDWDLKKHYYKSESDPQIEKDVLSIEQKFKRFAQKYRKIDFTADAQSLAKALKEYELLLTYPEGRRAVRYFEFRHTLNAKDSVAEKRLNLIENRLVRAGNDVLFFDIALTKIPLPKQKQYVTDPILSHFHYFLEYTFLDAKHTLSEAEERILNLKSGPSAGMWVAGTEKILSNREITFDKRRVALPEAIELINTVTPKRKGMLWNLILNELEQISEVAENEFNAIVTNKKISDELRGYKKPYSQTVQSYENNEKSVEALVEAIRTHGFKLSKRFYALKARFHKVASLPYVQKYDPIGTRLDITFKEAVEICRDVFHSTHPAYGAFFDAQIENGTIDAYPKRGKRGGAFMAADINVPTFVMLNHTDDYDSLTTLAHEMGHAVHAERSKCQSPLYEHSSITTAETASTLFESIVFNSVIKQATPEQKRTLLHDRITRDISTVQRQIAFYNFEFDMHTLIREQGAATKEELAQLLVTHLKAYLGPAVEVTPRDGYSFVYISHFRHAFYVYTYAYGHLMSSIMAEKLNADHAYVKNIDTFLSLGSSDTVENIFKRIGIDATKTSTFLQSLKSLEASVDAFEKLL